MTYDTRENGKIGILTLNNPDKMNALTEDMGDALKNVIDNISHHCTTHENHVDSSLRTVIITGAGLCFWGDFATVGSFKFCVISRNFC